MKNSLRAQQDLFAPAVPPAKLASDERVKAMMLLQSLLVEAASVQGAGLSSRNRKEAGDEQDHR